MFCANCSCENCVAEREAIVARLEANRHTEKFLTFQEKRREDNDQFDSLIWMLVNNATSLAEANWTILIIATAVDTTTAEINLRRKRYATTLDKRIRNAPDGDEPFMQRLREAGAIGGRFLSAGMGRTAITVPGSKGTELPRDRPVCPDCGENLRALHAIGRGRRTHVYGPCAVTGKP